MKSPYQYSIYLLSKRDYSIFKIRQKLIDRNYEESEIEDTIEKLVSKKFLREDEYKYSKIKSLLIRGYSESYISHKLLQEEIQINQDDITSVREEYQIQSQDQLDQLIVKKLRGKVIPKEKAEQLKLKNKLLQFLASKGHDYHTSKDALSNYF